MVIRCHDATSCHVIKKCTLHSWGAAQEFLTRDFLRMTADAWDMLEDKQREELLSKRLWVKDNQRVSQPSTF